MARQALLVGSAAGPDEQARRSSPGSGSQDPSVWRPWQAAIDQLRQKHVDLVILPLDGVADLQLATLEREIRRERYTAVIGPRRSRNRA